MTREVLPLGGLDLNLLVTLNVLLRESSVTRTAEILGQSQPTVSRALAALRLAFDDPLFLRSGRDMTPTPFALSLRQPLGRIIASLDALKVVGAFQPLKSSREFRVAVPEAFGVIVIPELISRLAAQAPGVRLVVVGTEVDALKSLLNDEVDLVISPRQLDHPELFRRTVPGGLGWSVLCGDSSGLHQGSPLDADHWAQAKHVQLLNSSTPPSPVGILLAALSLAVARHASSNSRQNTSPPSPRSSKSKAGSSHSPPRLPRPWQKAPRCTCSPIRLQRSLTPFA